MTKLMRFYVSATRLSLLSVLLAVCFCIWPAASRADLTSQDVYEAIYNGIIDGMGDLSAEGGLYTIPMDMSINMDIASYLTGTANYGGFQLRNVDVGYSSALLACYVKWLIDHPVTNEFDQTRLFNYVSHIDSQLAPLSFVEDIDLILAALKDLFGPTSFTSDNDLHVYDESVVDSLSSVLESLNDFADGTATSLEVLRDGVQDGYETLNTTLDNLQTAINEVIIRLDQQSNYWDEAPPVSYPEIDSEISSEESRAESSFDDIELPELPPDVGVSPSGQILDESAIDLGHVDVDGDHNALIRLVSAPSRSSSSIIPEVEIDLGRDSALLLGLSSFSSWVGWLASSLFGLLLSVKGLSMWRVVRTASVAAQCGTDPLIHLAFNPF